MTLQLFRLIGILILIFPVFPAWCDEEPVKTSEKQMAQYHADKPKTIIELQPFRTSSSVKIRTGDKNGTATLINLNPHVNTWHLLIVEKEKISGTEMFHLENPFPKIQTLTLDPEFPPGIIVDVEGIEYPYDLWSEFPSGPLYEAKKNGVPFAQLCDGRLYLRNKTKGNKSALESAADFLRRHVPGGEQITGFVKDTLYKDKYAETSEVIRGEKSDPESDQEPNQNLGEHTPRLPQLAPQYKDAYLIPEQLGLPLENRQSQKSAEKTSKKLGCGQWYAVKDIPGVFVSSIQPKMVAKEVLTAQKGFVKPLDSIEKSALAYLVAFDLSLYDPGFSLGTEHPGVGWSERVRPAMRDRRLPGPDGIKTIAPIVNTGMVRPDRTGQVISVFTGGFKRYHGAFRNGPPSTRNHASHYGFMEHGIVFSKLHPGLATTIIFTDNTIALKTWQDEDNRLLPEIRHARQHGVPIVEYDISRGHIRPGKYIARGYLGNWSGSAEGHSRTLRSGLAIQENGNHRFLIYGYFSTATPSAMACVFQAYHCGYAMLADMNALEHTYLALYRRVPEGFKIHHLITGMKVLDKVVKKKPVPRFVGFPDNRDFYYIMGKDMP